MAWLGFCSTGPHLSRHSLRRENEPAEEKGGLSWGEASLQFPRVQVTRARGASEVVYIVDIA